MGIIVHNYMNIDNYQKSNQLYYQKSTGINYNKVKIKGDDYDKIIKESNNFYSSNKSGTYGKGVKNTKDDPTKIERYGYFGELAFAAIFGQGAKIYNIKGGDGGDDFIIDNKRIDIKTSTY